MKTRAVVAFEAKKPLEIGGTQAMDRHASANTRTDITLSTDHLVWHPEQPV